MTEGGLEPNGRGVRTAQKVRLMHAAIRYMIRHDAENPWDAQALGQPINQEDLAGTLMTFCYIVLEGMSAFHIRLTPEQQESWLYAWQAVGHLMGVDERLVPASIDEARQLTALIRQRQITASPEGVAMTAALLEGMRQITPGRLDGLPVSMTRFFFDQDPWRGLNVADLLQVPKPDWTILIPRVIKSIARVVDWVADNTSITAKLLRFLSKGMIEGMLLVERGGQRTPFYIPKHLHERWQLDPRPRAAHLKARREAALLNAGQQAQDEKNGSSKKVA